MCQTCGNLHVSHPSAEKCAHAASGGQTAAVPVGRSVTHQRNSAELRSLTGGLQTLWRFLGNGYG